ncbi:hypothetical protein CB1_000661014 [Camelus ferus]|nr:hypothetical protein CB1_000661014 [Camelus ferus]
MLFLQAQRWRRWGAGFSCLVHDVIPSETFVHVPLSSKRKCLGSEPCLAYLHAPVVFPPVSHRQQELGGDSLCRSDSLWEQIVQSTCDHITPDMRALAKDLGWRQMFFTNKLQLQRHLRRRKQRHESQRSSQP